MTADGQGIPNIELKLISRKVSELGGGTRLISKDLTNYDGSFIISAYLSDDEIKHSAGRSISLELNTDHLFYQISNDFINPQNVTNDEINKRWPFLDRDTTLLCNYVIPEKGKIKINLLNFDPINGNDYFNVKLVYDYDFLSNVFKTNTFDISGYALQQDTTSLIFDCPVGTDTQIYIYKEKGSSVDSFMETIFLENSDEVTLNYDY